MLPNKRKFNQKTILRFWPFLAFFSQKNSQNLPKIKKIGKIQTINESFWNLVSKSFPTKENSTKKLFLILAYFYSFFGLFLAFLWPKKHPKLTKNKENWQNPNCLMKFSEIWYVDASQQKKCYKFLFWISAFFGRF